MKTEPHQNDVKQVKPGFTNYQPRCLLKGFEIPLKSFEKLQKKFQNVKKIGKIGGKN